MSEINISSNTNWSVLANEDNELILANELLNDDTVVKARIVPSMCTVDELHTVFKKRVEADILQQKLGTKFCPGWLNDSFICGNSIEKYRDFFFHVMSKSFVVIEVLSTCSRSVALLNSEVKNLIDSLVFKDLDESSVIEIGSDLFRVPSPSTFRLSGASSFKELVFVGEGNTLFVNVPCECEDLNTKVRESIKRFKELNGEEELSVFVDAVGEDFVRYCAENYKGIRTYGTYFKTVVGNNTVVSFLLENNRAMFESSQLLSFEEV